MAPFVYIQNCCVRNRCNNKKHHLSNNQLITNCHILQIATKPQHQAKKSDYQEAKLLGSKTQMQTHLNI